MALACDIRLAAPNATIGLAATRWAIIPGSGGTVRLPRAIPLGAAMEMILTGDPVDAAEAHRLGLVNRVVPREQLLPVAVDLAQRIAARGPLAVRAARAAVLQGFGLPEQEALRNEFEHFSESSVRPTPQRATPRSPRSENRTTAADSGRTPINQPNQGVQQ